jgi:hypothetical protein
MSTLRSILELYGSFDQALIDDDNPALAATIDGLFPGSSANRGWYGELEEFFFSGTEDGPKRRAEAADALSHLVGSDRQADAPSLVQQSQIFYGLLALNQVQHESPTAALPDRAAVIAAVESAFAFFALPEPLSSSEPVSTRGVVGEQAPAGDTQAAVQADVQADGETDESPKISQDVAGLLDEVQSRFKSRSAWPDVIDFVVTQARFRGLAVGLNDKVAEVPLCEASLATVNGTRCVVVDTQFTSSDVNFDQVLHVVNPYNWNKNYPDFFCAMDGSGPHRSDGWGRVLEHVSFCTMDDVRGLSTALKFYAKKIDATHAILDYDLDDPTPGPGDGQVTVDKGYITIEATASGVDVNTRKVVHITGIVPYAQARLVCITGYGSASMQFIAGAAATQLVDRHVFDYPGPNKLESKSAPAKKANAVPTAVKVWTQTLSDVTDSYVDLAEKWTSGGLTIQDVADYSKDVGGRLASTPWAILQALTQPSPPTNPKQGQGGGA